MCTTKYIYACFLFHSPLLFTKCPLCNFVGLFLLLFYFGPVSTVHLCVGVEAYTGVGESSNSQSKKEKKNSLSLAVFPVIAPY